MSVAPYRLPSSSAPVVEPERPWWAVWLCRVVGHRTGSRARYRRLQGVWGVDRFLVGVDYHCERCGSVWVFTPGLEGYL